MKYPSKKMLAKTFFSVSIAVISTNSLSAAIDGAPAYKDLVSNGLHIWRTNSAVFNVQLSAGGKNTKFTGSFIGDNDLRNIQRVGLESDDSVYKVRRNNIFSKMAVGGAGTDRFNFTTNSNAGVCLDTADGSVQTVYIGKWSSPRKTPVDLTGNGACNRVGGGSANSAPSIEGTPNTSVTAGSAYNFQPGASDSDGDTLTFSILNKPGWANFNSQNGRLYGSPTNANVGTTRDVTISVSDGKQKTSLSSFDLVVDAAVSGTGNINPNFVPNPSDFLYIDVNRKVNGSGLLPNDPTNKIPGTLGNRRQVFFQSDNGVQTLPCRDNAMFVNGNNIQISSYGSGRATVSAYQKINSGWTRVGSSNVWRRYYEGAYSGAGAVVGNVVDFSKRVESTTGDVLTWQNLEEEGNKIGVFRSNPTVLQKGRYAYDWQKKVMYVNVGANPNERTLGISCVGRFINTHPGSASTNVAIHNLNIIGFSRVGVNLTAKSSNWRIHNNNFYGIGGMYNVPSKWYFGSGVQMSENANNIEVDNNTFVQTFDSPITPQHFGGSSYGHLHDLHFHHNTIDKWALAAIEMADFGFNNRFSRITIEDNVAINGGRGFSAIGDSPSGVTDGIQVRGGSNSGKFTDLIIRRNKVNAFHDNIAIVGSNFTNGIIVNDNTLWGANYGIRNKRIHSADVYARGNKLCDNGTQIEDRSAGSQYTNNTLIDGTCSTQ